ncbi:hypothetical protein [Cryptosporidium parvum Iowa II]|uniref:Uncharacterized protein n=2 Tax=Cryptosporidium parvum TaxID=5807 RepID=A3FQC1_CRYPI|nr:hypothetical protein [Cryptosporidium parvum Iowa II]EAZ51320.1 hypothetical protein cgd1_620 [Cryptosporidium parvum Iowa II]QOY43567.1 Uncharacterized protein CPATCC_0038770 [Cryptosporidium parvum]WKS75960.1 hypothetical protein CPCDC_1g620 [Cryptosporidium sp. 43IA8]WRK30453.1 Uncharacterized protein cpbgf_100620 [Cryptosporidium parvum]|eukprot:QOY43567.1 hypothetical protein CPATCC_000368 [Cryptosporidium parvum]
MAYLSRRLKAQAITLFFFLIAFISLNEFFSEASSTQQKRELKSVRFVQSGQPPYVSSSKPGQYFRHLQTTVEQDSSSSPDESSPKEQSRLKHVGPKYRFVHAPVGYEKSKSTYLAEIQSLKEANEKLNEEVKSQAQKIKALMAENKELREKIEAELKKTNSSNSKLRSLEEDLKKKERQNNSLSSTLSQKEKTISEQKAEIRSLVQKIQDKETFLESKEKALSELEKQMNNKIEHLQVREKEQEKVKEEKELEVLRLMEKIEVLSANVRENSSKQESLVSEKNQLEARIKELMAERDNANKALNECLESLNAKEVKNEAENVPKETQPEEKRRALYNLVLKQMGRKQMKERWVKAPPLRRPEGINVESDLVPEIVKVFDSLKKKREDEFKAFVTENGLENEDSVKQRQLYEKYKEKNIASSPAGIQQFARFKKESVSD